MNTKQLINGSLVLGVALSTSSVVAANAFSFSELGEATSVRAALSSSSSTGALDLACGTAKPTDGAEKTAKEHKCGEGKKKDHKCGEGKKKDHKCGAKTKEHKCGEATCGAKDNTTPTPTTQKPS